MPILTIAFSHTLNVSIQPTDILYATAPVNNQSGTNHPTTAVDTKPIAVGEVTAVNHVTMMVSIQTTGFQAFDPAIQWYYFFGKNRRANLSGILGQYMSVEYRNHSKRQAEIFATGVEWAESSK